MKRSIIKLKFHTPLHFGKGNLSEGGYELLADTIFSALCIESGNPQNLVEEVKSKGLRISDAFPYIGNYYYIPKPMIYVDQQSENYKLFKRIKYVTEDTLSAFLEGTLYPEDELKNFVLGESEARTQVCVGKDPFQVGIYTFNDDSGLYIIVEHSDDYVFEAFEKLQYSGIGGKRSSGLGRFTFAVEECYEFPQGEKKILLNTAMAKDDELEKTLEGANYLLQKRSGFIHESRYKKRDFYTFKAGSIFTKEFEGDIFDVGNYEHPVYRYGIPMFMGVSI